METNKEKCIALLDQIPESKLGYALAFICGLLVSDAANQRSKCYGKTKGGLTNVTVTARATLFLC